MLVVGTESRGCESSPWSSQCCFAQIQHGHKTTSALLGEDLELGSVSAEMLLGPEHTSWCAGPSNCEALAW